MELIDQPLRRRKSECVWGSREAFRRVSIGTGSSRAGILFTGRVRVYQADSTARRSKEAGGRSLLNIPGTEAMLGSQAELSAS